MATELLSRSDLVIASAYGRGHWLATHLADLGWNVSLLDLTSALPSIDPQEHDGPFGLFETDLLTISQKKFWSEEFGSDAVKKIESGLSILLKEGPLDGSGQLATFLAQEQSLSLAVRNYLHMITDLSDVRLKPERARVAKLNYSSIWLAGLMHQLAANCFVENSKAIETDHASPFFASYSVRKLENNFHQNSVNYLKKNNVSTISVDSITSFVPESDESVTIKTNKGDFQSRSFVSTLSSEETSKVAGSLMRAFYPSGVLDPTWKWRRFIIDFKEVPNEVPHSFLILQDRYLPWTHANVISFQNEGTSWSCWLKLAVPHANKPEYLKKMAEEVSELLNIRLPWAQVKVAVPKNQESTWKVFDREEKNRLRSSLRRNVFSSGPEHWGGVDPLSHMLAHKDILSKLESIKKVWDARQAKREAKEQQRLEKQKLKEKNSQERERI